MLRFQDSDASNFGKRPEQAILLFVALVCAAVTASQTIFIHNNDANFYYGTALRVSNGRFLYSIEPFYSPLLSWLMAVPIALGMSVPAAYRVVNVLSFVLVLCGVLHLLRVLAMGRMFQFLALLLVLTQCMVFVGHAVTADLLTAGIFMLIWPRLLSSGTVFCLRSMIITGILGAAAYYAKAISLPIFIVALVVSGLWHLLKEKQELSLVVRRVILGIAVCCVLSLPWIVLVSQMVGKPVLSGQQVIMHAKGKTGALERGPWDLGYEAHKQIPLSSGSLLERKIDRVMVAGRQVYKEALSTIFGKTSLWIFVFFAIVGLVTSLRDRSSIPLISILAICHTLIYLAAWGGRIRYYLPVLPLLNLLFLYGLMFTANLLISRKPGEELRLLRTKVIEMGIAALCIVFALTSLVPIPQLIRLADRELVEKVVSLEVLQSGQGTITGNRHGLSYPGLIAYLLKREFWGSLDPKNTLDDPHVIKKKLDRGSISQIIWFDDAWDSLEAVPGVKKYGPFQLRGEAISIYNYTPQ